MLPNLPLRAVLYSVALAALGYLGLSLWAGWREVLAAVVQVGPLMLIGLLALSLTNYLLRYLPAAKGEIRCLDDDKVIGEHDGLAFHTIGQRKGLHIGGTKKYARDGEHDAWFVAGKDIGANVLYVVQGHDHPALLVEELRAGQLSWISGKMPHTHWVYGAKTRYRQADAACEIDAVDGESCLIRFAAPQWAVTPGQSVVVYESRVCLGGGVIV